MQRGGRQGDREEDRELVATDAAGPPRGFASQVSQTLTYVNPIKVSVQALFTVINIFTNHLS